MDEEEIRQMPVKSDPDLNPKEKETIITFPNDTEDGLFFSEVPTTIKWFLSIEESEITQYSTYDGAIVSIKGKIPKGVVKLQGSSRKSNKHSHMVTYGPLK